MIDKEALQRWAREQLDVAVAELGERGVFDDAMLEVKPAWTLPLRLLLGKAREQSGSIDFRWFICGEVPLDHVPSDAAATPRDALRHFAMKWQLDAEKLDDKSAATLVEHAEAVYALVDVDEIWPQ